MPRTKGRYRVVRAIPVLAAALAIGPAAASTAHAASQGLLNPPAPR